MCPVPTPTGHRADTAPFFGTDQIIEKYRTGPVDYDFLRYHPTLLPP